MNRKEKTPDEELLDYFEGYFEHRHKVQEIYDRPLVPVWFCILLLVVFAVVFVFFR